MSDLFLSHSISLSCTLESSTQGTSLRGLSYWAGFRWSQQVHRQATSEEEASPTLATLSSSKRCQVEVRGKTRWMGVILAVAVQILYLTWTVGPRIWRVTYERDLMCKFGPFRGFGWLWTKILKYRCRPLYTPQFWSESSWFIVNLRHAVFRFLPDHLTDRGTVLDRSSRYIPRRPHDPSNFSNPNSEASERALKRLR